MSKETLYTYYEIELENTPVGWDTTICESLEAVMSVLQYLDVHLDDPECNLVVKIKGIGMTREAFEKWKEENTEM